MVMSVCLQVDTYITIKWLNAYESTYLHTYVHAAKHTIKGKGEICIHSLALYYVHSYLWWDD